MLFISCLTSWLQLPIGLCAKSTTGYLAIVILASCCIRLLLTCAPKLQSKDCMFFTLVCADWIESRCFHGHVGQAEKPSCRPCICFSVTTTTITTSSNKQKPDLTCMVCDITTTSEVSLQEHLRGKSHGRKAAKVLQPLPRTGHLEENVVIKYNIYTNFCCNYSYLC